jgi:two-component system sensor kinase FixL
MTDTVKTFDWDCSPLGPRDSWPHALITLSDLMVASAQPMLIAWGRDRIFFYNDSYAPILGARHPKAFGRPFFEVWPEVEAEIGTLFDDVFAGDSIRMDDLAVMLNRAGGPKEAHFSFSYTPIRDDVGAVAGLFCICNETTDQVLAQRRIENRRLRQQQMLQQMPGFVAVLSGPEHVFQYVNEAFIALTGERKCVGLSVREAFADVEGQGFFELLDQVFTTGGSFNTRAAPIQFSGDAERRFIDLNFQSIKDETGHTTGVFVGGYDASQAVRGLEALGRSESLLASVVASSDDAIISKTIEGLITSWNGAAERLFGYSASEIVGQPISLLAMAGREDEMPAILDRLRTGERVEHFETIRRHKNGSSVLVSLTVSPIYDDSSKVIGASKVARDITPARAAAAALALAEDRLKEQHRELLHAARLGELGQMATTLTHEINQPLSAIINYLHASQRLLSNGGPVNRPMLEEAVQRAIDQAVRAAEVVRRLRTYAKPNQGLAAPVSINDILREAMAFAAIDSGPRGVSIKFVPTLQADMVLADRVEIQQVLLNLIRNALEAMEAQPRKALTLSTTLTDDMIEVAVSDTGPGLDPLAHERLFQPFVTTKDNGMGIGLSICLKIIEAHGGRLWVDERAGGGAVFRFTLRRDRSSPSNAGSGRDCHDPS